MVVPTVNERKNVTRYNSPVARHYHHPTVFVAALQQMRVAVAATAATPGSTFHREPDFTELAGSAIPDSFPGHCWGAAGCDDPIMDSLISESCIFRSLN